MSDVLSGLREIVKKYPIVLNDEKKLKSILKDYFPDNKRIQNHLFIVADEGIVEDMRGKSEIKRFGMLGYIQSLVSDYGITEAMAKNAIVLWAQALGIHAEDVSVTNSVNTDSNVKRQGDVIDYSGVSMTDYSGIGKVIKISGSGAKVFPNVTIPAGTYYVTETGGCSAKFYDINRKYDYIISKLTEQSYETIFQTSKFMIWDKPGILEVNGGKSWNLILKAID